MTFTLKHDYCQLLFLSLYTIAFECALLELISIYCCLFNSIKFSRAGPVYWDQMNDLIHKLAIRLWSRYFWMYISHSRLILKVYHL